jgi:hypothetical protein
MPTKETVIRNEIVRVNGKVKAITVPKEKTQEILVRRTLRLLDKKYEVLMPPADDMDKNTIDLQGMMTFIQGYLSMFFGSFSSGASSPSVQIVITDTSGNKYQLNYANTVTANSQGVTTAIQIFGPQDSMSIQYYFIGFDTTNNSYQSNYLELYSGSWINNCYYTFGGIGCYQHYSNIARIAYANLSINKQPNYDLFILWMIEFQNVPSYLVVFIPTIPNPSNIYPSTLNPSIGSSFTVYLNNGNCNFTCNGNCPSNTPNNFMISIQNNTIVLQIPVMVGINGGASSAEILICSKASYAVNSNTPNTSFSSSYSTTIAPPASGYVFYILMTAIAITFTVS